MKLKRPTKGNAMNTTTQKRTATLLLTAATLFSGFALADNQAKVQTFYDLINEPTSELVVKEFDSNVAEHWVSVGDYSGKEKSKAAFLGEMGYFSTLVPNLDWNVEEMIESGDTVVVRSRATGTPQGAFFGVDGKGKSFDILAIDIHTFQSGKIVKTYHVEDWSGAIAQLSGE
jgi:predicted ester cyclase